MPGRTPAVTKLALGAACATLVARAAAQPSEGPPAAAAPPTPAPSGAPAAPGSPAATPASPSAPPRYSSDLDPTAHLRFRHTWVTWDHAVNAQALGLGGSYQSADPTYTMSASFQPRYYLYDGGDEDAIFAEGRVDLIHEFTNSDVTTRRGETTLSDATLTTSYVRMLALHDEYATALVLSAPILTLPTSKFSYDHGTIAGLGTEVRLNQAVPLAGPDAPLFQRLIVRGTVGYNHTFTRAVVPTDLGLRRVRLTPEGRTVPGDQLTGIAFPEHEPYLRGRALVDITNRIAWWFEASYQPTWKYGFGSVDVCIVTGCTPAARPADPSTFVVVTAFQTEFMFDLIPELGLDVGYINVETQPGPDGLRRSIFYSPGAQVYLELVGMLDAIYVTAEGHRDTTAVGHHLRP